MNELDPSDIVFEIKRNLCMNMNASAVPSFSEIEKQLPPIPDAIGTYANCVRTGNLLFLSGKGPLGTSGVVGRDLTREQAYNCARDTGLILIAVMKKELGDLSRVRRIVKVLGMVNATEDFQEHPFVINGCSDLFVEVFGENGRHARSAFGVKSLPFGIPVEIEVIVEVS
jgi:enamine deaminase RidA (YjgF/YER057c/UK114 family)